MPVRRMLDQTLTRAGYEVRFAATLDEALDTLPRPADFDGALADLELLRLRKQGPSRWDKFREPGSFDSLLWPTTAAKAFSARRAGPASTPPRASSTEADS